MDGGLIANVINILKYHDCTNLCDIFAEALIRVVFTPEKVLSHLIIVMLDLKNVIINELTGFK